ncbi:alpha/beta fold hydrolase [Glacieibacterium sp.]|uniref:alpha/beta fold hydrolase n=1 Tax=Glacieibacterium sp. TaxID=2860237 RepID=UPI003AFFFAC2
MVRHRSDDIQPVDAQSKAAVADRRAAAVPVLLLPGTLCDERVFQPLLDRLPKMRAQVVELTGTESANAMARRILADAPYRFALIGFSLGGIVGLEILALAPERVVGIALVATNPGAADPQRHAMRRAAVADADSRGIAVHTADTLWPTYSGAAPTDEAIRDLVVDMARRAAPASYREQTEIALGRADSRNRLASCKGPVLVLGGDADRVTPIAVQHDLVAPGAVFATVPGAGHFLLLENPDAAAAHIGRWHAQLSLVSATVPTAL